MNDELLALAERLSKFLAVMESARRCENKAISVWSDDVEIVSKSVDAIRLAAQSPEPVAWVQPNYLMALEKVGLVTAYVEKHKQADAVPLYAASPRSASDGALREALDIAVDIIMASEPGHSCAVSDIAVALAAVACGDISEPVMKVMRDWRKALAASEATKSDGGEERPASNPLSEVTHRPSDPHEPATVLTKGGEGPAYIGRPGDARNLYEDSARDTRPADVTVEVRAKIDWWLREISDCNERMWNGSREMYFGQIDKGVGAIRALLDTYKIGAK